MWPSLDHARAVYRGRYMQAAARMEWNGTPIDTPMLDRFLEHRVLIQSHLTADVNRLYPVYVPLGRKTAGADESYLLGADGTVQATSFSIERWEEYLIKHDIPWPLLKSGALELKKDVFRQMAETYPDLIGPFYEVRT